MEKSKTIQTADFESVMRNFEKDIRESEHITKTNQTLVIDYPDTDDIKTIIVMDGEGFTRVFEERRNDE